MKSMCEGVRRNSPSVASWRPTSRCCATTSRIASSSTARSPASSSLPALCSARAWRRRSGRRRLPTWSAPNGGEVRCAMSVLARAFPDHVLDREGLLDHAVLLRVADQVGELLAVDLRRPQREPDLLHHVGRDLRERGDRLARRLRVVGGVLQALVDGAGEALDDLLVLREVLG